MAIIQINLLLAGITSYELNCFAEAKYTSPHALADI